VTAAENCVTAKGCLLKGGVINCIVGREKT